MPFFSIPIRKDHQTQFAFIWQSQWYNFKVSVSYLRNMITIQPYVVIVYTDHDSLSLPQNILVVLHTDTRLIGPREWEVVTILNLLVGHLHVRGRGKNPKFRGLLHHWNFQGFSDVGHVMISLLRWRISCCIWPLLQPKKRHSTCGTLWISDKACSSFGCALLDPFTK